MDPHANTYLLVLCVCFYVCYAQELGKPCVQRSTGEDGTCELLNRCESAKKMLNVGRRPTRCGFEGSMPVVCCDKKSGDISQEKCKQYAQYVYTTVTMPDGTTQSKSTCVKATVNLIIGGTAAKPKQFPHQALLGYGSGIVKKWNCGGSLISDRFALTAAHCCSNTDPPVTVLLGEHNLKRSDDDARPEEYTISDIIIHPQYNTPQRYHDIALLKLSEPVRFNAHVRPACLHTQYEIEKNKPSDLFVKFIASGWGKVDFFSNSNSDELQSVALEQFSIDECRETFKSTSKRHLANGIDDDVQICAGGHTEAKDTCLGDSGGPLQIESSKRYCMYEIVGVTSFGKACGTPGVPGVYTRVSNYIKWIEENVWTDE